MRINATIPIWHADTGQWIYRPSIDGVQKKYTSRREGKAGYNECIKKHNAAIGAQDTSKVRLEQAWKEFLVDIENRLDKTSGAYMSAESIGRVHILPRMKNMKVAKITEQDWQDCIYSAKPVRGGRKELSKKYLINMRAVIMAFCKFAKKKKYIDQRPDPMDIPKKAPILGRNRVIMQLDTLKAFLTDDSDEWYLHLWQLMTTTGLRPGEALGIKRTDINGDILTIRRSINRIGQVTGGKTENAKRSFVLKPIDQHFIKLQTDKLNREGIISPWLFCDNFGNQPNPIVVGHHWIDYRQTFAERITQYGLRHTFVSHLKSILPDALMKQLVGHSESMPTNEVYAHFVTDDDRKAAKLVGEYFNGIIGEY